MYNSKFFNTSYLSTYQRFKIWRKFYYNKTFLVPILQTTLLEMFIFIVGDYTCDVINGLESGIGYRKNMDFNTNRNEMNIFCTSFLIMIENAYLTIRYILYINGNVMLENHASSFSWFCIVIMLNDHWPAFFSTYFYYLKQWNFTLNHLY